jgi:hypothetical protein
MDSKNISNKNRKVILRSILSANTNFYEKLQLVFDGYSEIDIQIVLLSKLEFSLNEIKLLLGKNIQVIEDTINDAQTKLDLENL